MEYLFRTAAAARASSSRTSSESFSSIFKYNSNQFAVPIVENKIILTVNFVRSPGISSFFSSGLDSRNMVNASFFAAIVRRYCKASGISDIFGASECRALLGLNPSHRVIEIEKKEKKSYLRFGFSVSRAVTIEVFLLCLRLLVLRVGLAFWSSSDASSES